MDSPPVDTGAPTGPSSRRSKFYHETIVLEVEGILHRVYRYGFEKWSNSVFRDMFALPQGDVPCEGASDENPIQLVGCTNEEFESLLEVMYPLDLGGPVLEKDEWADVLRLARLWDMPKIAAFAIEKLGTWTLTPIEKITLGKAHGVPTWLKEGYTDLIVDLGEASIEEVNNLGLGWETAFRILWAREGILPAPQPSSEEYFCYNCKTTYARWEPIAGPTACCSKYCGQTGNANLVIKCIRTTATSPADTSAALSVAIAEKVSQVFAEELQDAERRNATTDS